MLLAIAPRRIVLATLLPLSTLDPQLSTCFAQGSLSPPGGPAPAMKSLDQIEPRTPLAGGTNSILIDRPGSYYLAGNLATTGTAIRITADNVTIDLNGFALIGTSTNGTADFGVHIDGAAGAGRTNVVVRNGTLNGFYFALYFDHTVGCRGEQLIAADARAVGLVLSGSGGGPSHGNLFLRCRFAGTGGDGIWLFGAGGECNGNRFESCHVTDSGAQGIVLEANSGGRCNGNVFRDCSVTDLPFPAFYIVSGDAGQCDGNVFDRCTATRSNFGSGFSFYAGNNATCNGNVVRGCSIGTVGGAGVSLGGAGGQCNNNTVEKCAIEMTGSSGILVNGGGTAAEGNVIRENIIRAATDQGIWVLSGEAGRVEGNHITGTTGGGATYGIRTTSATRNLILKNSCATNGTNYSIDANDTSGPVVSTAGALANTGAGAHPWANYSR